MAQPDVSGEDSSPSEATVEDAVFEAQTDDATETEIIEDAAFQEHVNSVVDPIILKHEEIFSEAGFEGSDTAYVVFAESIPEEDASIIRNIPGVTLREDGVYTADEADDLMEQVSEAVEAGLPEDTSFMVQISPVDGEATITASDAIQEGTQSEVRRIIADSLSADATSDPQNTTDSTDSSDSDQQVVFAVDQSLDANDEAVNGGDKLTHKNTTRHACTAAFPARSGRHAGLLTAGHCSNDLTVDRGNRLYPATKERTGLSGDMQWHRARERVNGRFRYKWGTYRAVKSHPVLKVGTRVCRFGATSGNGTGCTTVKYVSACITYTNVGKY